jgi:ATP-binding cassette subfamily B protein
MGDIMLFGRKKYTYVNMITNYIKMVPFAAAFQVLTNIIGSVIPTFSIVFTARFIDGAIKVAENKGTDYSSVVFPIAAIVLMMIWQRYIGLLTDLVNVRANMKRRNIIDPTLAEKRACLKFKYYENQETMDVMSRVTDQFYGKTQECFNRIFNIWGIVAQIGGFLVVLGSRLWWASLLFLVLSVPSFIISYRNGKKQYDTQKDLTKVWRKVGFLFGVLTGRNTIEERFTFGYVDKFNAEYKEKFEFARTTAKKVERKRWIDMKLASGIVLFSGIIIMGLMIPSVRSGALTIGLFTSLINGIWQITGTVQWEVSWQITEIKYQMEFIKDLNKFLEYEEDEDAVCLPDKASVKLETIEFRHVYFKYPRIKAEPKPSDQPKDEIEPTVSEPPYILKDFNLTMRAGKHYAIVGVNGAGKTTLTKLLTGLYTDYDGEILINGRELRTYNQAEIKAMTAVVYQDFCRYNLDFHGNIAVGNINDYDNTAMVEHAVEVMELGDVVDKLSDKYKTPLTKIKENGVDLSGGEWQRVALARLIVNPAPLKILDEPTAALDPISESRVYEKFGDIVNKHTTATDGMTADGITIFISHRLGSTRLADEIIVISEGKNAEMGTFEELMAKSGLYAEMFESQAAWYRDEKPETEGAYANV